MFRLSRTSVNGWTAVVAVIAALSYALTGVAIHRTAAEDKAKAAPVEFTADGKLNQPAGYRKWAYVGEVVTPNDMNDGEAAFPEFHSVYMDPESFAEYEKTGKYRDGTVLIKELSSVGSKNAPSRRSLLPRRVHRLGGLRSRTRSASRTSPATGRTSASAASIRSRRRRRRTPPARATSATRTTPRRTGSSANTTRPARRPRIRTEIGRACPVSPTPTPHVRAEETIPHEYQVPGRLAAGCLAAVALVAATNALVHRGGTTRPPKWPTTSRRTSPRTAAVSRPTDYRDTFEIPGLVCGGHEAGQAARRDARRLCTGRRTSERTAGTASSRTARTLVKEVTRVGSERLTTRGSPTGPPTSSSGS